MLTEARQKERALVLELQKTLEPQFDMVWSHKKISASPRFKAYIKSRLGYIPILQPEFDLVFKRANGDLNAIEVKYLSSTTKGYNLPYYVGIGQALALQRFGFDHVGLWLIVGSNVSEEALNRYGPEAYTFIRNELKLPIEYSYLRLVANGDRTSFLVMKSVDKQKGISLVNVDDPRFRITWKHPNPLKSDATAQTLRTGIELYLNDKL